MNPIWQYLDTRASYRPPTRYQVYLWALLIGLVVILAVKNWNAYQVGAYWDDGSYVVLAKSILSSSSYGHMSNPGAPLPTRYPFGFPLLLAPLAKLPNPFQAMKTMSLVATLFNVGLLFWGWSYLSREASHWWSLAIIAISALSPMVIGQTGMVMSEPVFTTFMLLSLIVAERLVSDPGSRPDQVLLGVFLAYAMQVRTVGIFLIVAALLSIIIRLRWKSIRPIGVGLVSGILLVVGILGLTNISVQDLWPRTYLNQGIEPGNWGQKAPGQLVPRLIEGSGAYIRSHIREVILPIGGGDSEREFLGIPDLPGMIGVVVTSIVLVGLVTSTLHGEGLLLSMLLFEILYMPVMLLWPWRGARFLYALQPFMVYQFLLGVLLLISRCLAFLKLRGVSQKLPQLLTSGVVIVLTVAGVVKSFHLEESRLHLGDLQIGTVWLRANSEPADIVLARNPDNIFLYSDRRTLDYPRVKTQAQLREFLSIHGVDYILIAPKLQWSSDGQLAYDDYTAQYFLPLLTSLQEDRSLVSVFKSEPDLVEVFQVIHED